MAKTRNIIPVEMYWTTNKESGCWNWIGGTSGGKKPYGKYTFKKVKYMAHRFVLEKYKETIPFNMELDHLCKNTLCVNPEHLRIVTRLENMRTSSVPKLTVELAAKIREKLPYTSQRKLAKEFNVSQITISNISRNKIWI